MPNPKRRRSDRRDFRPVSSVQSRGVRRFHSVSPETESETLTPESIAIQVLQENGELAGRYAGGDLTVFATLQDKALALAAGRLDEQTVKDTLLRKLGAGI